jgi:hypothetical protein
MASPAGGWQPFDLSFNTFNANFIAIYFFAAQNLQSNALALDDFRLIPEPSAGLLLILGLASSACLRRRTSTAARA